MHGKIFKEEPEATSPRLERMAQAYWAMHCEMDEARGRPKLARWEQLPPEQRRQARLCMAAAIAADK